MVSSVPRCPLTHILQKEVMVKLFSNASILSVYQNEKNKKISAG